MALVYAAHGEIGERVLGVIIETHHVRLVIDLGIESRYPDIISVTAELVVQIGGKGLGGLQIRNKRIPRSRGNERL